VRKESTVHAAAPPAHRQRLVAPVGRHHPLQV